MDHFSAACWKFRCPCVELPNSMCICFIAFNIFQSKYSLIAFQISLGLLLILIHHCKPNHLMFSVNRRSGRQLVIILKEITAVFQAIFINSLGYDHVPPPSQSHNRSYLKRNPTNTPYPKAVSLIAANFKYSLHIFKIFQCKTVSVFLSAWGRPCVVHLYHNSISDSVVTQGIIWWLM